MPVPGSWCAKPCHRSTGRRGSSIGFARRSAVGHYSGRTEDAYVAWIRRYIVFHGKRHPAEMGPSEITSVLSSLAVEGNVAASTQNQALSALLFLYREVLELDVPWLDGIVRAKRPQRLPVVLSRDEVRAVLRGLDGAPRLMAYLLYGAGLRLLECCRLRVQDVDFASNQIVVRSGKGDKDRVTMLPGSVKADLARHLESVREQHRRDLACGAGWVELPTALDRKYPNAGREWPWQWVFPATRFYVDRVTGQRRRHHLHETVLQRAVKHAVWRAGLFEARRAAHTAPFVRDPLAGRQPRHPNRSGATGAPGRHDHDGLHARAKSRAGRGPKPGGSNVRCVMMRDIRRLHSGIGRPDRPTASRWRTQTANCESAFEFVETQRRARRAAISAAAICSEACKK